MKNHLECGLRLEFGFCLDLGFYLEFVRRKGIGLWNLLLAVSADNIPQDTPSETRDPFFLIDLSMRRAQHFLRHP